MVDRIDVIRRSKLVYDGDGKEYEIGSVYYTGSVLMGIRHGDPRIIVTDIAPDELDSWAEETPIRIHTGMRRQKRKQARR